MELRAFTYGQGRIDYRLRFSDRNTLEISVHPDGSVEVVAPAGATMDDVERILQKRARWVVKQQRFFEQFVPRTPSRRYVSGETHLYLGRQYRLKVIEAESPRVRLFGGRLFLETLRPDDSLGNAKLLAGWYLHRAQIKCSERLTALCSAFRRYGVEETSVTIRPMRRRWGSLSPQGRITLNLELVKAPMPCIDYVIVHELCHLVHDDHSATFYRLLERVMPDWQTRKERLERMLV